MIYRRGAGRALVFASILTAALATAATALPAAAMAATGSFTARSATAASATPTSQSSSGASLSAIPSLGALPGLGAVTGLGAAATVGGITGVVRGANGAPLAGACVTATGPAGTIVRPVTAGGRYVIRGLRPGAYTVSYRDCADPARYFEQWYGGADLAASAAQFQVHAGAPVALTPVTLRLTSPAAEVAATAHANSAAAAASSGVVTGTVRNRAGKRLAGICAGAFATSADSFDGDLSITGRRGGYEVNIGTSRRWEISFFAGCGTSANYAPQWWRHASTEGKATYLHGHKGRNFAHINATLQPGAAISGTVRAAGGSKQALSGVCVDAAGLGAMREVESQTVTRRNGSYVVKSLGTGRYQVSFDPSCGQQGNFLSGSYRRAVSVTDGKTTTGINGALQAGGEISGVVTSQAGGTPLAGICVDAISGDNDFEFNTAKDGSYSIPGLRAGSYQLAFSGGCDSTGSYAPQYYLGTSNEYGATPVTLSAGQVRSGIDAAMAAGGTVSGKVTNKAGTALAGVCVVLISRNEAGGLGQNPFDQAILFAGPISSEFAVTGSFGRFSIENLEPGQYAAEFSGGCGHGSLKYAQRSFAPQGGTTPTWVSVGGGAATTGVNATMTSAGSISGTITGKAGRSLSNICVVPTASGQSAPPDEVLSDNTSHHGAYKIEGLAAGRYKVYFTPCNGQPYASQWYKNKAAEAAAAVVSVRAGHTTTRVNAALASGGTISGRVVSGVSGTPVNRVCIVVTDSSGNLAAFAATGKSGSFRIAHLAAGRWDLGPSLCESANPGLAGIVRGGVRVKNASTTAVRLTLPQAGRISGTVQGGLPVAAEPGICVEATPTSGNGQSGVAVTNASGHYTLEGLARGHYRVLFTPLCLVGTASVQPQWFSGQSARASATPVSVAAGQTTTSIGGTLLADGGIAGTVTNASDVPVPGVCVGAYAGSGTSPAALAITGTSGSYEIGDLAARQYTVKFTSGCGSASYPTQWYNGVTSRATATPVTVTPGAVASGIDAG